MISRESFEQIPQEKKKKTLRTDTRDVYRMPTEWKVAKRKSKIREEFVYRAKCRSKTSLYKEKKKSPTPLFRE